MDGGSFIRRAKVCGVILRVCSNLARDAACSLRKIHEHASTSLATGEHILSDLPRKSNHSANFFRPTQMKSRLLEELKKTSSMQTSTHKTLLQGDFWHGNLIRGVAGELMLIDWQYARWDSDVSLDVYLFLLAGALANTPVEIREIKLVERRNIF